MARATGYAPSTRMWQAFSLQPSETFKLSADPYFVARHRPTWTRHSRFFVWTEAGSGPRSHPCCRCGPARSSDALMTRNGTTSLFAALDMRTVIGQCHRRHRARGSSWITSAKDLDRHGSRRRSATGSPGVRAGMSITPTSASWLNQVDDLTEKQIRRGVHRSTAELERAITDYMDRRPPSRSDGSADDILASIKRFCRTLETAAVAVS